MKHFVNSLIVCLGGCILFMMFSCEVEATASANVVVEGSNPTPLPHQINRWLSTDWIGDEITMFITDNPKDIQFLCISGKLISIEMNDCFVSKYYTSYSSSISSSFYRIDGRITPLHVGKTYLHIQDSLFDTLISVKILAEFYTYTEPQIDFDDTEDSVNTKLHELFGHCTYYSDSHYYQIGDSRCRYNLYVNYSEDGVVDNYIVELYQGVESAELTGYINERYYKTTASVGGLPVYIKAHNNEYPSISDATVVVIPDLTAHKVKYQNPLTYSN